MSPRNGQPRTRPVPTWAADLVAEVCAAYGRLPPRVQWWQRPGRYSSGHTAKAEGYVHVTAGTDPMDQRLVVLHELAHWLGRPDWAHRRAFWGLAWQLYGRWMPHHLPYVARREAAWAKALAYCPFPELHP